MNKYDNLMSLLMKLGLTNEELYTLSYDEAIDYLRFHHFKAKNTPSVLFLGFSNVELEYLKKSALSYDLIIRKIPTYTLTFLVSNEAVSIKFKEDSQYSSLIFLSKEDFCLLFPLPVKEYSLTNKILFEEKVPVEFRIPKPLSDFDKDMVVDSFSMQNDKQYTTNMFKQECSCAEFLSEKKGRYLKGDIRRLSKHLLRIYSQSFGLFGLTSLQKGVVETGYSLKRNFKILDIERISYPIAVSYNNSYDWWDVFVADKHGVYQQYGYSPLERRFAYNDKVYGYTTLLKKKLNDLRLDLEKSVPKPLSKTVIKQHQKEQDSQLVVVMWMIIIGLSIILYWIFD